MQAKYKTDIARLAEDAPKRQIRLILATTGLIVGVAALLGVPIRLG